MAEDAFVDTPFASFLVEVLAFLRQVKELVGRPAIVEAFVGVDAVVPVMVLAVILTILSLVSVKVEESRLDSFEINFQLLLLIFHLLNLF